MKVELTADDEVIVTELRPMRIAPYEETILALYRRDNIWYPIWSRKNDLMEFRLWIGGPNGRAKSRNFIGWMPLPTYKPKLTMVEISVKTAQIWTK